MMSRRNLNAVVRYLQQLTGSAGANAAGDAELLERYVRHGDEAAFELLLWRHGTLVFNVCRRILSREQDAEDAFQATFLAFVRKADSISRRGSVASWLYKVAFRVALEAKQRARKTAVVEKPGGEMLAVQPASDALWSDVRPILDEELNHLPERLRRPIVLCYLEGKSNEEAARELGCRLGTIYSRLSRGREMLRQRLQRRGVTLSVVGLTALLTARAAEAAPAISLMRSAVRAALAFADPSATAAVSPRAATLAEGVLKTMFVTKLKIVAVLLLVVGLAASGVWTHARTGAPQAEARADDPPSKPKAGDKQDAKPIAVKVVKPKQGGTPLMKGLSASVVAAQQQQVVPLVSGTVKDVLVEIGDRVTKGQTLMVLDAPLLGKEREQAGSAFELAQAEEQEAEARALIAAAEVEAAKAIRRAKIGEHEGAKAESARWQTEVKRIEREVQKGVVDPQVLMESQHRFAAANAKVKAADAAVATAEAGIKIKQGNLEHAKAALRTSHAATRTARIVLEKAHIQEGFTQLKAAFDGIITRRTTDPGNFVQPSDSRLLRPLLTVQRIDTVRVVASVSHQDAPLIKRGLPAGIGFLGRYRGEYKISRFTPALENDNHEMTVEIDVPNAENRLLPGMMVAVQLPLRMTAIDSVIVPSACVYGAEYDNPPFKPFVYVVREGKAYKKEVTVRDNDDRNIEIANDLKASDLIIATKQEKLRQGTPVKIENSP